jgi:putative membrane protein
MHIGNAAVVVVGLLQIGIAVGEIFLWKGSSIYMGLGLGLTKDESVKIAPIVANAGLYNAFIAAGLILSVWPGNDSATLKVFFLTCVAIAGLFGAATLNWKPLVLQTIPALIAGLLVWLSK